MKTKYSIKILLLAILQSCYNRGDYHQIAPIVTIDVSEALNNYSTYTIENKLDSIKIIPLQTSSESALSLVTDIQVANEHIYIRDLNHGGSVSIFDLEGKFIKKIQHGSAQDEIGAAQCFCLNKKDKTLSVFDMMTSKIVKYDSKGVYLSHNYLKINTIRDIQIYNDKFVFAYHIKNDFYIKTDTSVAQGQNWYLGRETYPVLHSKYLQETQEGINVIKDMDDNIYVCRNDSLKIKYHLQYPRPQIDYSKLNEIQDIRAILGENKYLFSNECIETQEYLYLIFISRERTKKVFYNKKSKEVWSVKRQELSLFDFVAILGSHPTEDSWFVGTIRPELINSEFIPEEKRCYHNNLGGLISPSDIQKLRNLKEDDNPVIVLFKLKSE